MNNGTQKYVFQIIGNDICVEPKDGEKVYNIISKYLNANKEITLSFRNITIITSSFLNSAIGLLYKDFSEETISTYLKIVDMQEVDHILLNRVIITAKRYFENPTLLEESIKKAMEDY